MNGGAALAALALSLAACGSRAPAAAVSPSPASSFDGQRAFEHVRRMVEIGPRPAGSPGAESTRAYLVEQLRGFGLSVREDRFTAETPGGRLAMANVVAELPGELPEAIILASHYDTKRLEGFVGANDAGSSTGAVLELARVLATDPGERAGIRHSLWFVFFDGEEAVADWTDEDSLYGSRHMVESLRESGRLSRVRAMVLLDMIGDRELTIPREASSTPWLMEAVVSAAVRLGHTAHFPPEVYGVVDDHTPFLRAGVPAVNLIDLSYGTDARNPGPGGPMNAWWHTTQDTLDKISARSLQVVGEVVLEALPRISAEAEGRVRAPSAPPAR